MKKTKKQEKAEELKKDKAALRDGCYGPLRENCEDCSYVRQCIKNDLKWYTQIPHWLIDHYLAVLSPTAFKVFMYLNRKANFDPHSNHYLRCWPSRAEIAKIAGVSKTNIDKQLKELEYYGLIKRSSIIPIKKKDGSFGSSVTITISWMKKWKELLEKQNRG